ncbi:M1 family metallopeptidase [Phnomibacter ginsenosidimutans]|uniref:M1 family peptidase n=1 Tax=Phnomibacter ginsenosidimutans TaxID=2676868 RepID=A0A6I6G846_9BACT|nr:M1 family metallopeptidase [Phnomibacter ginsenosidimutans]QGW28424.1 M1 family peptidase [Phnomibacter ginsenosidimutans]
MRFYVNVFVAALLWATTAQAQPDRWQQQISYNMDVRLNVQTNILQGKQQIQYTNNSPDTLHEIYFHLYWNAFQPNSSMDVRSRELGTKVVGRNRDGSDRLDWDGRVKDRISQLKPNEIGYCRIQSITLNGVTLKGKEYETIIKFDLPKPILPKQTVSIQTQFEAQVPVQIRRSGRDNAEGVRYSMSQWYPKVVEYDYTGWTPNPYIAREFYGVWGDYDVNITLDKSYKIGASGVLQNAAAIGWGYDKPGTPLKDIAGETRSWRFTAKKVHDFVWAADPGYQHITRKPDNGPLLHFIFKSDKADDANWVSTANECARAYPFMKDLFGAYPWPEYSFIQGGDGGMEYAMATLIKTASLGTAIHEWMHSWYQHLMGTNESLYAWMDEGFTSYGESVVTQYLKGGTGFALADEYRGYIALAKGKFEEPMSTHADHFATNYAYSTAAYSKGAVFLGQLGYVIGDSLLKKTLHAYYDAWKFKHPNPNDFVRVAEKVSGMELDWYKEYMLYTTKTIDYAIDSLWMEDNYTLVRIKRLGEMPMPVDVTLTFKDSTTEQHYVPLNLTYGEKPAESTAPRVVYPAQRWTHREMIIRTNRRINEIISVEIDASQRLADIERKNNKLELKW